MKKIYTWIAALMMVLAPAGAIAQNLESGYFTDGYLYRHEMNPAIGDSLNYVAMPLIGNVNLGLAGNLNLTDVLFYRNGRTVLYTNPLVSADEVMKGITCGRCQGGADQRQHYSCPGFHCWRQCYPEFQRDANSYRYHSFIGVCF